MRIWCHAMPPFVRLFLLVAALFPQCRAFSISAFHEKSRDKAFLSSTSIFSSKAKENNNGAVSSSSAAGKEFPFNDDDSDDDDDDKKGIIDDETLLKTVPKSKLADLCSSMNLSTKGSKQVLLQRLRQYAHQQAKAEHARRMQRVQRVQEGSSADNPKERYEVIHDDGQIGADYFSSLQQQQQQQEEEEDVEEEDDDFVFFFESPEPIINNTTTKNSSNNRDEHDKKNEEDDNGDDDETKAVAKKKRPRPTAITSATLTAPPPPDVEPNEDGERVVTVYSTTDENDLTGIAAAQPGQAALSSDALTTAAAGGGFGGGGDAANRPWDPQSVQKKETDSEEVEQAKEEVSELVQMLLAMTGAPAYRIEEDDDAYEEILDKMPPSYTLPNSVVGFNPGVVPTEVLTSCSRALRTSRGEVLQDVLREFELNAIGQDGMAGDKTDRGGGHYREVSKVRAFLEGYRRAEVRRIARQTAAMLLDKLVQEGVEGLDITLASMTRSTDDTSDVAGELNDSLYDYLNDAIRQQEQKVNELGPQTVDDEMQTSAPAEDDRIENLWNVTTGEDGERVESLDPNDPNVQSFLREEQAKSQVIAVEEEIMNLPDSAPEKLLLLLKSLRERLQAEAAFGPDEKGRNLRLLAYCLRLPSAGEREQLITKDLGRSLDRLDSFIELVASSIEYGESTSYQLQPTQRPLNVFLLKSIYEIAQKVRRQQATKASGYK